MSHSYSQYFSIALDEVETKPIITADKPKPNVIPVPSRSPSPDPTEMDPNDTVYTGPGQGRFIRPGERAVTAPPISPSTSSSSISNAEAKTAPISPSTHSQTTNNGNASYRPGLINPHPDTAITTQQ